MAPMLQRNPRYVFLVLVICVGGFLFFTNSNFSHPEVPVDISGLPSDPSLSARIARSEKMYQKTLEKREELLKKHGPTPSQVLMCDSNSFRGSDHLLIRSLGSRRTRIHGRHIQLVSDFALEREACSNLILGDFFPPTFDCPHDLERVGMAGDGGKWICGLSRLEDKPDCVIYTFGSLHITTQMPPTNTVV